MPCNDSSIKPFEKISRRYAYRDRTAYRAASDGGGCAGGGESLVHGSSWHLQGSLGRQTKRTKLAEDGESGGRLFGQPMQVPRLRQGTY